MRGRGAVGVCFAQGAVFARGAVFVACAGLAAAACVRQTHPPPLTDADRAAPTPSASGDVGTRGRQAGASAQSGCRLAPPPIEPLLDEPVLAEARVRSQQGDWKAVGSAVVDVTSLAARECTRLYAAGRWLLMGDDVERAASALDAVPADCVLAHHARLRSAQGYVRLGKGAAALERLDRIAGPLQGTDEWKLLRADALALMGRKAEAAAVWRSYVASAGTMQGFRVAESAVRLSQLLVDGAEGDSSGLVDGTPAGKRAAAREAHLLSTRVVVEHPKAADAIGGAAARKRAHGVLRSLGERVDEALSPTDILTQAQAWLDGGAADKAQALLAPLAKARTRRPKSAASGLDECKLHTVFAKSLGRKPGAADAWGSAVSACKGSGSEVSALYHGAKSSSREKRLDEARARYTDLRTRFADHRLADDACFLEGLLALDAGDEAAFARAMEETESKYTGDMGREALFRLALHRMTKGDVEGAIPLLERIAASEAKRAEGAVGATANGESAPASTSSAAVAGWARATYFLGRMAALRGDKDGALRRFRDVMERHPYGYFMVLSAARLRDADPAGAKEWLAALHARSRGEGSACSDASVVPQSAPFELVRGLLEAGDVESARAEITRAGWLSEEVPRETVWASLYLLERAGRPDLAHGAARTRLWAWLARYPESYFRQGWELAFPKAFEPLVLGESARNALPPSTVWSVMREESGFVAEAKSPANAYGLLQLVPGTAKLVGKGLDFFLHAPPDERSLLRPEVSIALGARLLAQLQQGFATHPALALAAYNAGSGAVGRWMAARGHMPADLFVETIPYEETRLYVKKVLASRVAYAALYSPTELDTLLALPNEAVGGAAAAAARLP